MSEAFNIIENNGVFEGANIKVVGVGGAGGNMLNHMMDKNVKGIELVCANTDAQALNENKAPIKIQLGKDITKRTWGRNETRNRKSSRRGEL